MPKKLVSAKATIGSSYEIDLTTRQFSFKVDQPKPSGNDIAPTPLEYFFAALGACACTIGKIVSDQKKIDLNSINVDVEGDVETDFLLGKTKEGRAGFTSIRVNIEIDANASDQEKRELVDEIKRRCPVSDNIENISNVEWIYTARK